MCHLFNVLDLWTILDYKYILDTYMICSKCCPKHVLLFVLICFTSFRHFQGSQVNSFYRNISYNIIAHL